MFSILEIYCGEVALTANHILVGAQWTWHPHLKTWLSRVA